MFVWVSPEATQNPLLFQFLPKRIHYLQLTTLDFLAALFREGNCGKGLRIRCIVEAGVDIPGKEGSIKGAKALQTDNLRYNRSIRHGVFLFRVTWRRSTSV